MPKKKKKIKLVDETTNEVTELEQSSPVVPETEPTEEPKAPVISFTYTINNDGKTITKNFVGDWSPQDVILTLYSCIIGDIKTNIMPEQYKTMLDFLDNHWRQALLVNPVADEPA